MSRVLEIAKVLRDMGYEIIFGSEGDYIRLPQELGFKIFPVVRLVLSRSLPKRKRYDLGNSRGQPQKL